MSDWSRLARYLAGQSIGVVLGGGGARGIAHVGFLQALREHQVPVDFVGGTSIGAFMGALYAQEEDLHSFYEKAREWCTRDMSSPWNCLFDITFPTVSWFKGTHLLCSTLFFWWAVPCCGVLLERPL